MEGLGKKLQEARIARNLTLDEAARLTKIRPGRLAEIENEDFSQFASLAYAKGFLLIYGKFLDVDVSPYMEAFETSEHMTVDGYSYLQDNPAPKPSRPVVVRKSSGGGGGGSLLPFVIGVIVLIVGFTALKFILDLQRLKPKGDSSALPTATPTQEKIIAPRAQPVENTNTPAIAATAAPTIQPTVSAVTPTVAATAVASPSASEPEVRRAEPVHPDDLVKPRVSASPKKLIRRPTPTPSREVDPGD